MDRDADDNCIVNIKKSYGVDTVRYKLLDTCEFTSTRKRMSCIFQRESDK